MTRDEATKIAAELAEQTGVYHCAVRDNGDWFYPSGWHVENVKGEEIDVCKCDRCGTVEEREVMGSVGSLKYCQICLED